MKKRNRAGGGDDSGAWLNTYADMVTLLLTFFVVLLSMSNTDEQKFNAFVQSFSSLPQEVIEQIISSDAKEEDPEGEMVVQDSQLSDLFNSLQEYVEENNRNEDIQMIMVDDVVYIRFSSSVFFNPDQYTLREDSLEVLDVVGSGLKEYEESIRMINVLGFTATVQDGEYWMLSAERAAVVASRFNFTHDFPNNKLTVIGYGNQYPVASNDSEEGMRQNRRVELIVAGIGSPEDFNMTEFLGEYYNSELFPQHGSTEDLLAGVDETLGAEPQVDTPEVDATDVVEGDVPDTPEADTQVADTPEDVDVVDTPDGET